MPHVDYFSLYSVNVCEARKQQNWALMAQAADEETERFLEQLTHGQLDPIQYVQKNELLYYKYSLVGEESRFLCFVLKTHRLSLLRIFHDEHNQPGEVKTLELTRKHYWFFSLK